MEQGREEEDEELEEDDGGPERALEKSPFQLTAGDVYDISSVVGRDLLQLQLSAGPPLPAALARLQFRIVRVLEMLEALLSLGPDKMVIDLTDPNRPRFTLQELRDVLQERNQLKAQLLVVQEELQCYKSGIISQRKDQTEELEEEAASSSSGTSRDSEEKTIIKRLQANKIVLEGMSWNSSSLQDVRNRRREQSHRSLADISQQQAWLMAHSHFHLHTCQACLGKNSNW
ncbi:Rilpl2 [Columba guinea]|nr:Rilpl2 [Columba guinea]